MSSKWFYAKRQTKYGPVPPDELQDLAKSGFILPADMVLMEGMTQWIPASSVVWLFPTKPVSPPPPQLSAPKLPLQTVPLPLSTSKSFVPVPPPQLSTPKLPVLPPMAAIPLPQPVPVAAIPVPAAPVPHQPRYEWPDEKTGPKMKWWHWVLICLGILVLLGGIIRGFVGTKRTSKTSGRTEAFAGKTGTITFAEEIDPKTMRTFREGNRFTTGVVWMVIRSPKALGDSRIVISSRVAGEAAWQVISEEAVDPTWNICVGDLILEEPGRFEIRVTTSRGEVVAQSVVEITRR